MSDTRSERDSMGEMQVPAEALYGAQTARAVENFPVSGMVFPRPFLRALGMIKERAARVNLELGLLDEEIAMAIMEAAEEVVEGKLDAQFVVDIFQTGSGTSTNMNANEVIANRAAGLLGADPGTKTVHPNDHVNLGQIFSGYARQLALAIRRLENALEGLLELPLGGTAVGTGLNTHPAFAGRVIAGLAEVSGLPFKEAANHFEAQAARDAAVAASGALRSCAVGLFKIANDIRFLASGPRCGLGELQLPAVQPGSSIMPGKVNPVMAESLLQVCAQVIGNDAAIGLSGLSGNFELNVMMPVISHNLLQSVALLERAVTLFAERCVQGLEADRKRCGELVERSLALVTALAPVIGYDRAAELAKRAHQKGGTIREVVLEAGDLDEGELDRILDPRPMTEPGLPGKSR